MDIQAGQTWSVPPHGPEIRVHSIVDAVPEQIVSYSVDGENGATHDKPLSAFQSSLKRLLAKLAV